MPVTFLSRQHRQRYGRYVGEPGPEQLARYFHLDDVDLDRIRRQRTARNRLDYASQLCTVRFLGRFSSETGHIPANAFKHIATQLDITLTKSNQLIVAKQTRRRHLRQIKSEYGYRDFSDPSEGFRLVRWLYTRIWISEERPSVLFDLATARLVDRKVLLPGATTLERLVSRVRDRVDLRLWNRLLQNVSKRSLEQLHALLAVADDDRTSDFDQLRNRPTHISGPALTGAINRIQRFRDLHGHVSNVTGIPPGRLRSLADQVAKKKAQNLRRMEYRRRLAMLRAFVIEGEGRATDDAFDIFDALMTDITGRAKKAVDKARLQHIQEYDEAAMVLVAASTPLLNTAINDANVRNVVFRSVTPDQVQQAIDTICGLAQPTIPTLHTERIAQYNRVRPFLRSFLKTIQLGGMPEAEPVLNAMAFLRAVSDDPRSDFAAAPRAVIPRAWRRTVINADGTINRAAYTMCVLDQLQSALRRRDIFALSGERWSDPRMKLIKGRKWRYLRPQICRSLGRYVDGEQEISRLSGHLDATYRRAVSAFPSNDEVKVEHVKGHDRLVVTPLDRIEETDTLRALRDAVATRIPHVDLSDLLLEIEARTQFSSAFTHTSERNASVDMFAKSLCAVLVAEACNTGLSPISRVDDRALTRSRLTWVEQNYLRHETIVRANARLVNEQARLSLAKHWGGGDLASADGLRFRTPTRTIHSGPNPKYFGVERGITWINFTSDYGTGFHGIVVPGTLRDSMYILEGLLEHQTDLELTEIMSDSAGASEMVFALFWLLGYQFSPRLADIGGARFWRVDNSADYGPFNDLSRHRVRLDRVVTHWDDILRVVASLKTGTVSASELMRSLLRSKRPSPLARALRELGRVVKTLHHLNYISDTVYRRRTLTQLNHHENRHRLTRRIFFGKRGEVRQHYREGQEEQLGILGLVVNAIVLWNTIYMQEVIDQLREEGMAIDSDDIARLQPHRYSNVNVLGRYSFNLAPEIAKGALRPLRDPDRSEI